MVKRVYLYGEIRTFLLCCLIANHSRKFLPTGVTPELPAPPEPFEGYRGEKDILRILDGK